ncbi:MAG: glucuronosyltransferase [bacterium]|nr:glucuronosyltransferase [bacterium]
MIYVTVGTLRPFPRLVKKMDEIAPKLGEEIIMQMGDENYRPSNASFFDFCTPSQHETHIKNASVVITHAAVGITKTLARLEKKAILVVRRPEFGEVANDHQLGFSGALEKRELNITIVYDFDQLEEILRNDRHLIAVPPKADESKLIQRLREVIIELCSK